MALVSCLLPLHQAGDSDAEQAAAQQVAMSVLALALAATDALPSDAVADLAPVLSVGNWVPHAKYTDQSAGRADMHCLSGVSGVLSARFTAHSYYNNCPGFQDFGP